MALTKERIQEIAARFREMADFARDEYIDRSVTLSDSNYLVDLGQFGDKAVNVQLQDTYQFDAEELLDQFPIGTEGFDALADEFEGLAEVETVETIGETGLEAALERMQSEGEVVLANFIREVVDVFRGTVRTAVDLTGLSIGPLPPEPLPWPGALRPEIDYTAEDFPLRYQPPPGFRWAKPVSYSQAAVEPTEAKPFLMDQLRANDDGYMLLDNKGRVSWRNRADDDLSGEIRWPLWFIKRDGIPAATGAFDTRTPPLPISRVGEVMDPTWSDNQGNDSVWTSESLAAEGKVRVLEIIAAYEESILPKNEYGVRYDPTTAELEESDADSSSANLRVGDFLFSYGRVLKVESNGPGRFKITTDGCDGNPVYSGDYGAVTNDWSIRRVVGWENQPTALSLSQPPGAPVEPDYDPLTVAVKTEFIYVPTEELRLGDDIVGSSFGRVVSVNSDYLIEMDRDGARNTFQAAASTEWQIRPIDLDREQIATAVSLAPGEVELPF